MKYFKIITLSTIFLLIGLIQPKSSYALCGYWNFSVDTCPIINGLQCQMGTAKGTSACCNPMSDCSDPAVPISTGVTGGITVTSTKSWINDPNNFLSGFASEILLYAVAFVGLFFLIRLISAGFTMMTSTGDPSKIEGAKQSLSHAFIGLTITLSIFFIAQILKRVLGLNIPGL